MPYTHEIDPGERIANVVARGAIDFDESVAALRALADDPAFRPEHRVLADFRGVTYTPSLRDLQGFLAAFKLVRRAFQGRTALVVSGWLHLSLARTACALASLVRFEMSAFDDPARARVWLDG
jgi:hypothetical protein